MNLGPSHPSTRASIQFSTISGIRITGRYTGKPHVANSYVDVDANDPGSWNKSVAEGGYEQCGMWSGQQVRRPLLRRRRHHPVEVHHLRHHVGGGRDV